MNPFEGEEEEKNPPNSDKKIIMSQSIYFL